MVNWGPERRSTWPRSYSWISNKKSRTQIFGFPSHVVPLPLGPASRSHDVWRRRFLFFLYAPPLSLSLGLGHSSHFPCPNHLHHTHTHTHTHTHIVKYSQFSIFTVAMFYTHHEPWISQYWAIALWGNTDLVSCKPLVITFSPTDQYIILFYVHFHLKTSFFNIHCWYINVELTANSALASTWTKLI